MRVKKSTRMALLDFNSEYGGGMFLRNTGLHGGVSRKTELLIATAVRTQDPTGTI
jgi:hypothetical protein